MRSAVSMLSLIRTGMPCSGPRGPFCFAFVVEGVGDAERIGIEFDDAVHGGAVLVDRLDAREVFLGEACGP